MAQYELNLRDYYRIFRKRRVTVLLIFCLTMAISYYRLSSQKPTYQSSIKLKIAGRGQMGGGEYVFMGVGDLLQTQLTIIESYPIAERAAQSLGWLEGISDPLEQANIIQNIQGSVKAMNIGQTSVIRVTATSLDPEAPTKIAEAVAEAYRAYDLEERNRHVKASRLFIEEELRKATRRLEASEEIQKQFKENVPRDANQGVHLRNEITRLEIELEELILRATPRHPDVERLQDKIAAVKEKLRGLPEEELTLSRLEQEVTDNQNIVSKLREKLNEARIRESENMSIVSILEKATPARGTFRSDPKTGLILSAMMGLLLGFVCAFFKEGMDTSIGVIEDVESFLEVPVLGAIPHMIAKPEKRRFSLLTILKRGKKAEGTSYQLITQLNPRAPEAESYHTLRTSIYSVLPQKEKMAIAISSTGPKEGKSLTCANLAVVSAQMGKKTLLIDADFRRPKVHEIFGLERIPGLFEVLTKTVPYHQALKNVSDLLVGDDKEWQNTLKSPYLGYLNFMTVGHLTTNPPEVLDSQGIQDLVHTLLKEFDFLIFDCPPILPVTDTLILAPKLDGVILVYQSGRTARNALKRAKIQLDTAKAKLLGVVFNDIRPIEMGGSSSYYYRYRKYYADEDKKEGKEAVE